MDTENLVVRTLLVSLLSPIQNVCSESAPRGPCSTALFDPIELMLPTAGTRTTALRCIHVRIFRMLDSDASCRVALQRRLAHGRWILRSLCVCLRTSKAMAADGSRARSIVSLPRAVHIA